MVIPPNQMAAYAIGGMFVLLIIMDLGYYKNHFKGPQAALEKSIEEIKRLEDEFEHGIE
jgi:hypothetical protein